MNDKILEMKMYLMLQETNFANKYQPFFQQAKSWGWFDTQTYLKALMMKEHDKMSIVEKLIFDDMKEIDLMYDEVLMTEQSMGELQEEPEAPFPLVGKFKEQYIAAYNYAMKFRRVEFADTVFCPHAMPGESFDDRLRKLGVDPDEEVRKCIL
jgi:hypothetical protein